MKCVLFLISLVLVFNVDSISASFLFSNNLENLQLGCFSNTPAIYPSTAIHIRFSNAVSTAECTNMCFQRGRKYAAVNPRSCFCFDEIQHQRQTSCDNVGNGLGHAVIQTYFVSGDKGCFLYNKNIYTHKYTDFSNSPSYCIAGCKVTGYKYAGLLLNICTCSNAINHSELGFAKCNDRCTGATGMRCGGTDGVKEFLTVYPVV